MRTCRSGSSPTAWSPGRCATPRRSSASPSRSTATSRCRRSATSPARRAGGCGSAVYTEASVAATRPGGRRADAEDRRAARGARPPRRGGRRRRCPTASPTTSCSTGRCSRSICPHRAADLRPHLGPRHLDNLTLGLARHCGANLTRCPGRSAGCGGSPAVRRTSTRVDVALTPTLATQTPRVGHLDPTQDYETVMERLLDWVAFTPLQNATGDPAISLPLAPPPPGCRRG